MQLHFIAGKVNFGNDVCESTGNGMCIDINDGQCPPSTHPCEFTCGPHYVETCCWYN